MKNIKNIKNIKLLLIVGLIVSCTPNVNNPLPSPNKTNSPSPKVSNSPIPSQSPKPTDLPIITPSITVSTPSSNSTPKPLKDIQKINVYSDEGRLINTGSEYKILPNEIKTFKTEIVYKDGTISNEPVNWSSSNLSFFVDNNGTLKTNGNLPNLSYSLINVSSDSDPNYKYTFQVILTNSLVEKTPYYTTCGTVEYKEEIISRYKEIYTSISYGETITPDIKETATFSGKIFDPNGNLVEGVTVSAKAIDAGVNWSCNNTQFTNGKYVFRNAPVGARLLITVTKDGWTTRARSEVLKSNLQGDPMVNIFDFSTIYSIQDEPEITMLKVNGRQVNGSSNGDVFLMSSNLPKLTKPTPDQMDNGSQIVGIGNVPSMTGVNSNTLEIEMTFSEPVNIDDVRSNFRIISQSGFDNKTKNFIINSNTPDSQFDISADQKVVTFKTNKAILANKGGDEARYIIDFAQPFKDKTGKLAIDRRYFRFSPSQMNDFAVFSVKNDEVAPKLLGITAKDGVNGENDKLELRYSEPMELISQSSYSAGLADPMEPTNLSRQVWYRDANNLKANTNPIPNTTTDNNATLFGFLNNSDTDTNQFRASYMIGRILASEISSTTTNTVKASILGNKDRNTNLVPIKANSSNTLIKSSKIQGNIVTLEFDNTAFDKDDRVIVSVANRITGNFVDRNRTPSVNDELSVSTSGTSVEYASIYDPAGRLIDDGDLETRNNIDVNNSQRVATVN
ncbi:MAG: carboxypeptidase-like regulatory domain-containing protein [Candidatus Sericytochromatia bacterium]